MTSLFRQFLKNTPIYASLSRYARSRRLAKELSEWENKGRPVPPPHVVKQQTLRDFGRRFGLRVLVETGTFRGDMVEAMRRHFDRIITIELSQDLHERAKERFCRDHNVELVQGDSSTMIRSILAKLDEPALFWLDGHYSAGETARGQKDTPILDELAHIFDSGETRHVLIIDDARCFGRDAGYPTLEELESFVRSRWPAAAFEIENDSIRVSYSA